MQNKVDTDHRLGSLYEMVASGEATLARVDSTLEALEERIKQRYQYAQARLAALLQSIERDKEAATTWTADALRRVEVAQNAISSQSQELKHRVTDTTLSLAGLLAEVEEAKERVDGIASQIDAGVRAFDVGIPQAGHEVTLRLNAWQTDIRQAQEQSGYRLKGLVESGERLDGDLSEKVRDFNERMAEVLETFHRQRALIHERSQHSVDAVSNVVAPETALTISMLSGAVSKHAGSVEEVLSAARVLENRFSTEVQQVLGKMNKVLDMVEKIEPAVRLIRQLA